MSRLLLQTSIRREAQHVQLQKRRKFSDKHVCSFDIILPIVSWYNAAVLITQNFSKINSALRKWRLHGIHTILHGILPLGCHRNSHNVIMIYALTVASSYPATYLTKMDYYHPNCTAEKINTLCIRHVFVRLTRCNIASVFENNMINN